MNIQKQNQDGRRMIVPVKFFDEYIVQISFGMDYLSGTNQNISNKYDPIFLVAVTKQHGLRLGPRNKNKSRKKLNIHH